MRTHTQDFKTKIKEYGRQFNDTIYYNNNTYDGERINSVNYTVDTSLMRSVMQTLKIDTDIPLAKGDTLDYGISLEGVTGSEIRFNNFIVDKVEDQKDKNSKLVTCYDNMIKTMVDYAPPGVTYPVTVRNYINAICTHLGITFKNASSTFTNYNKQITSEHYVDTDGNSLGYTFRDVLDDLAEATGSFICIDNAGELEIRSVTNTNDTIDEEYFKDKNVTVGAKYGPINVVILSRGDDSDNLYRPTTLPVTKNEIKITDNPILDQDNREDFIDGIYNQLNGLEYYTNDFATNGILYYEVGDKFNVSIDNTTYSCLMLADNIKRTTGLSEKIYTKEPSTSVSDYKYASDTDKLEKTSRNAWIKANKAEGTAEMIVEGIGSQGQVTGASVIAAINGDQSNLSLNADKINLNGAVTANNNFKILQDGSVELNDGVIDLKDTGASGVPAVQVSRKNHEEDIWSMLGSYGLFVNQDYTNERYRGSFQSDDLSVIYEDHTSGTIATGEVNNYGLLSSYEDTNNSDNDRSALLKYDEIRMSHYENGSRVNDFSVNQYGDVFVGRNCEVDGYTNLNNGATITGGATISGTLTTNDVVKTGAGIWTHGKTSTSDGLPGVNIASGGIEIFHNTTPLIDFHYANSTSDYTSRLSEIAGGVLKASGALLNGANTIAIEKGYLTSQSSTTSSATILTKTFTSHGGRFLVIGVFGGFKTSNGNTEMRVTLDSGSPAQLMTTNATSFQTAIGFGYLGTISAGSHTMKLVHTPNSSSYTSTVDAYKTNTLAIIEF